MNSENTKKNENVKKKWIFELYIAGQSMHSLQAIANLHSICKQNIKNEYQVKIIDVSQNPAIARQKQIIALPTIIRVQPSPERKIVGDLSELKNASFILDV